MLQFPFQYGLTFIPQTESKTTPEIVFILCEKHLTILKERIVTYLKKHDEFITSYLKENITPFALLSPDVFGEECFGFGDCGYVTVQADIAHIHIRMSEHVHYPALTIKVLSSALASAFELTGSAALPFRDISLRVSCGGLPGEVHGYAAGGALSCHVIVWLQQYAKSMIENGHMDRAIPIHPGILSAMREVWVVTIGREPDALLDNIRGFVTLRGYFVLSCDGPCGIAPSQRYDLDNEFGFVDVTSHNLDNPIQQLTLLAGLAKLCDLARSS